MQHTDSTPKPRVRLTEARTKNGWSQQDVANQIGTTHVNVSRWERGITRPSPFFRRKICSLFQKSEYELDLTPDLPAPVPDSPPSLPFEQPVAQDALFDSAIPLLPAVQLIGRNEDLGKIRDRLCTGGSVALTALNGLPGVGKTALAITLSHDPQIRSHFEGILWAALGPHANLLSLLSRWGSLLGLPDAQMATFNTLEAWAKALRAAIGSRRMLLVIDDAWTLEAALTLKVGGPNCTHLLTTRFPYIASHIAIEGATILHELNTADSMALLRQLAPQVIQLEEQKALDLVQAVGGLPLALTLMGNYLRKQGYTGQARRIQQALERLSNAEERLQISEPHVPVESHPSLQGETPLSLKSVIAVTDQLLPPEASQTLYMLSLFPAKPNSFSEEAALAVTNCSLETLDLLNDTGLLESSGSGRYTLHQTIADYAHLHLSNEGKEIAGERLIAYVASLLDSQQKEYEVLDRESPLIISAFDQAHQQHHAQSLVRAVISFTPFMLLRAWYTEAATHLQQAVEAATSTEDHKSISQIMLYQGQVAQNLGSPEQAEKFYTEGLRLARQLADDNLISAILVELGSLVWRHGQSIEAEHLFQEGLVLARQLKNPQRISTFLRAIGSLFSNIGDYTQSETYLQESLGIARQISDQELLSAILGNLAATAGRQGKLQEAQAYLEEALTISREIDDRKRICISLINLGQMASEKGEDQLAEKYCLEGLVLARQINHREWTCALLLNLGQLSYKQERHHNALLFLQESLDIAQQIANNQLICVTFNDFGNLYLKLGQISKAEEAFQKVLSLSPTRNQELIALATYGLARVTAKRGQLEMARELGIKSFSIFEAIGNHTKHEVHSWLQNLAQEKI